MRIQQNITQNIRRIAAIITCLGLFYCLAGFTPVASEEATKGYYKPNVERSFSLAPIIATQLPSVVNIYAKKIVRSRSPTREFDGSAFWRLFRDTLLFGYGQDRIENSLGSGVIVRSNGIVVTNHHVIQSAQGIVVALNDGGTYAAEIILSDEKSDIAVLRINTRGRPLSPIEFGDSDALQVGDLAIAIGNPFGLGQTVTSGIVSALARSAIGISDFRFFIQTDAAINPGNSGGALLSSDGKLVGINTAIVTRSGGSQGLGFAVPSNRVSIIIENALQGRPLIQPWIGASGIAVSRQSPFSATRQNALLITSVFPGGPADNAGLKPSDIVLSIDHFPIISVASLRYRVANHLIGDRIKLQIARASRPIELEVTLRVPPNDPPRDDKWLPSLSSFRGAKAVSLSPALAEEFGLDSTLPGVVLLEVRRGSSSARLGLRAGDIIRSFKNQKIRTVRELENIKLPLFTEWALHITRSGNEISIGRK